MSRWSITVLSFFFVVSSSFANPNLFNKAARLYQGAGVPVHAQVKPQSLWLGKCVDRSTPYEKNAAGLFFYVDVDTVLGSDFYIIPLTHLSPHGSFGKEAHRAVCEVKDHNIELVTLNKIEKAWRTSVHYSASERVHYFIREGKGADGQQIYYAKALRDGEVVKFCYYYQQITEDASDEEIVPAPAIHDLIQ